MKKLILATLIIAGIVACDTPKPTTGTPEGDTTSTMSTGADSTLKRDSIPRP